MKKTFFVFVFLVFSFFFAGKISALEEAKAEIYYSPACSDCLPYLEQTLVPALEKMGVRQIEKKDFIGNPQFRQTLDSQIKDWQVPTEAVGHMMTFVWFEEKKILLAGHVPPTLIEALFTHEIHHLPQSAYPLGLWQDVMHGEAETFRVWSDGRVGEFLINIPLTTALAEVESGRWEKGKQLLGTTETAKKEFLLPTVLVSGFLDGLNPCAFAVLLFLIAFIFMLKKARLQVLLFGLVYIGAIYLAYLLIGLGLWKALIFTGTPHLMAKVGSVLVILLGLVNLKDYFAPKILPFSLRIPFMAKFRLMDWFHKGTLPATFVLGFLVGLCTFPCSGGIYVAIVSLLSTKMTLSLGLFYLLIYNLMFVLPLIIILALAGNRLVTEKLTNLQEKNEPRMRLLYGLVMIGIGAVILLFFV